MIQFMKDVIGGIQNSDNDMGYVTKIFWNCGEYGGDPNGMCNPSLTKDDGTPTALLDVYKHVCG